MSLPSLIARRIAKTAEQRITFAEYMDWVLYDPQSGYYATKEVTIGPVGDFLTSPHLGADFGELLAEQFVEMWERLGHPVPFTLLEMGAGQGLLAADILQYLHQQHPEFIQALEYVIVEKAVGLIAEQKQRLKDVLAIQNMAPVKWCSLEEIPSGSIVGCCFSNELVDALPVHQFVIEDGQLREIYVAVREDKPEPDLPVPGVTLIPEFREVAGEPSTPQLMEYFDLVGIDLLSGDYPEGYRSEVNLAALDWLRTVADKLQRGYLLTIDYGYSAVRYYNPQRRLGTLQCYYRHMYHDDPYVNIGQQDITAHVDFTALERWGERCGLQRVGFTQQGLFLMALGLGERIAALSGTDSTETLSIQQLLRRRDALHQLIEPTGLGGFGVLVQGKGLGDEEMKQSLKGLKMPELKSV